MSNHIEKREVVINKVKRTYIVIFLKRFLPFVIFILILFLSVIVGLWNIRAFEYESEDMINVSTMDLDSYLNEYIGKNIFLVSPSSIEQDILDSNGYIQDVNVKKVLPSKLHITFEEYIPYYAGYSSERCLLFSKEGFMIEEVCNDCKDECITQVETLSQIYITSDTGIENSGMLIFYDEFYSIVSVLDLFKYEINNITISNGITTFSDTNGHSFVFDLTYDLEDQIGRLYLVCEKINADMISFSNLDLRFERPVMRVE